MRRWFDKAALIARYCLRQCWRAIAPIILTLIAPIGFRELLLFAGAGLLGYGLSFVFPPAAFIAPGLILVYVSVFGTS